jgi:hypothetical protein
MKRGGDVMEYQNFSLIKEDIQADAWGRISLGTECSNRHYRILMNTSGEPQKPAQEISLKKQSI